ncbi:uncharacterized alpha-1,2-galactosyltransferase C1289.13c-like [Nymphaea colorata]|nr:uncharacterized alpha-1,2-galactosyltransferase C1289.13c-like [Nymphaea colorata]
MVRRFAGGQLRRTQQLRRSGVYALWALSLALGLIAVCAGLVLRRANVLGRRCGSGGNPGGLPGWERARIAMVSCSAASGEEAGPRDFQGLMELVTPGKQRYAEARGYDFIDASEEVDRSRPPSWSKILAVKRHLHRYDWVFWNDADSLVTNFDISIEEVLADAIGDIGHAQSFPDLILTTDVNGVNAGMFFMRNSSWSQAFLDTWWNQTSFIIRQVGSTKSGDNDALKHLVGSLPPEQFRDHVRIARMQCLFNSYPWIPSLKSTFRLITAPKTTWRGAFSDGDFMVHLAGLDDKKKWARRFLCSGSLKQLGCMQALEMM